MRYLIVSVHISSKQLNINIYCLIPFELNQEVADSFCVYRNVIDHEISEFSQTLQDVTADPTLPRTKSVKCAVCGHPEVVFLQVCTALPYLYNFSLFLFPIDHTKILN